MQLIHTKSIKDKHFKQTIREIATQNRITYIPIFHRNHWLFIKTEETTKEITQYDSLGKRTHYGTVFMQSLEEVTKKNGTFGMGSCHNNKMDMTVVYTS